MASKSVLRMRAVERTYGRVTALESFDLVLRPGECVALIGHNGSGKTTAARIGSGHLTPSAGAVTITGIDIYKAANAHVARARVALVADHPVLYDDLTVIEHLELVALAHGVADPDPSITRLLDRFGLAGRSDFVPPQLSRGMRQKTQIACALARPFNLIVLDEPVAGLDPPSQRELYAALTEAKDQGAAILMTTHQIGFPQGLADRGLILENGSVVDDAPFELLVGGEQAHRLGLT